jgi:uncharacterized protein YbjT (DUF2867 family)
VLFLAPGRRSLGASREDTFSLYVAPPMDSRPLIAVADATGLLGGSATRAILDDVQQRYRVRALVRNPHASTAVALAHRGAEMVAADLDDSNSVLQAVRGALGFFAVTDFWQHGSPERELSQARAMSVAARLADVEHVIWSTQEDSRRWLALSDARIPTLMQRYKVPPFDAKGESDAFFAASGVPVTLMRTGFVWEQLLALGMGPRRTHDAMLTLALPLGDRSLPSLALADVGTCVRELFAAGTPPAVQVAGIAAAHLTGDEMASAYAKALGEPVQYEAVAFESWRSLGLPGAESVANMFHFVHDFDRIYAANRSVEATRRLYPALQTFDEWLVSHSTQIPSI